jgi:hypothetical protein
MNIKCHTHSNEVGPSNSAYKGLIINARASIRAGLLVEQAALHALVKEHKLSPKHGEKAIIACKTRVLAAKEALYDLEVLRILYLD